MHVVTWLPGCLCCVWLLLSVQSALLLPAMSIGWGSAQPFLLVWLLLQLLSLLLPVLLWLLWHAGLPRSLLRSAPCPLICPRLLQAGAAWRWQAGELQLGTLQEATKAASGSLCCLTYLLPCRCSPLLVVLLLAIIQEGTPLWLLHLSGTALSLVPSAL